jgi:hypothetical protein
MQEIDTSFLAMISSLQKYMFNADEEEEVGKKSIFTVVNVMNI